MTIQIKEYHSVSAVHPPLGILLRVIATTATAVSAVSATTATVGLCRLAATTRTTCTSTTMATSIRRTSTIARSGRLSVVPENHNF